MVSNSAQLDRKTKQHTQFGVSASNGSRDIIIIIIIISQTETLLESYKLYTQGHQQGKQSS